MSSSTLSGQGLEVIARTRVYTEVVKQLQERVISKLKPGDLLPSERELVQTFGVSRSSIRDAIRSLEAIGRLEPRQGVGTVICDPAQSLAANPLAATLVEKRQTVVELLEVRNMLEPPIAARAARHATPDELAELEAILSRQEEMIRRHELAIAEDSEFHYCLALAADNSVVLKIIDVLMDLLRETRVRSLQAEGRQEKSLAGHRQILAALKRGDAEAAASAMRRHLSEIEKIVLNQL
jgi:GntR family transcriptional regulator, transcriptional repressor for pyruvate dehydrogenase complex